MAESLFSPSWYRVARLKPRLRGHSQIHRHFYRGELWYVLQDHVAGRFYRFSPVAYQAIGLMDGSRTVEELWEEVLEHFDEAAPSQGEMIKLLTKLHNADVLLCDVPPDTAELFRRGEKVTKARWKGNLRSPLSLRFPLIDPDKFLNRTIDLVRPVLSLYGALIWLAVVGFALIQAGLHWSELTENITDRVLSIGNLFVLWFAYPMVKLFHELGHGYAAKRWGGEVHEMGIMLLVLMPIPYVEASSSSAFRAQWKRVLVGAAGMLTELFIAAIALLLWVELEPGAVRSVAYNVVIIGGVSTLFFNGNPLLRYDGYYILSDLLGIPNLAQRSLNYLAYLIKRYLLGLKDLEEPYVGPGEKGWLVFYAVAAFIYRIFIYAAIILFIAGKFFFVGVLLAIWAGYSMLVLPLFKRTHFMLFNRQLTGKRLRAWTVTGTLLVAIIGGIFLLPLPLTTRTEGVVWVPEDALVRAGTGCQLGPVLVASNSQVKQGELLMECSDPVLVSQVETLQSQLREFNSRYIAAFSRDEVQARMIQEDIDTLRENLARAEERRQELQIRSPQDGIMVMPNAEDLPGRYIQQGELLAYVLPEENPTVRVVISQSDIDLVRQRTRSVAVRPAENLGNILPAAVLREVPGAIEQLPSSALGRSGGGEIAIDPFDTSGMKAFDRLFQLELDILAPLETVYFGSRVFVRFDHGFEPLAFRWYRDLRQLFLRRFNV